MVGKVLYILTDIDLDLVLRACRPDLVLLLARAAIAADFGPDIPCVLLTQKRSDQKLDEGKTE